MAQNNVKQIVIKNNWSEVSINDYLQLLSLLNKGKSDIIDIQAQIVSLLTNLTLQEVNVLSITDFSNILNQFEFLNELPKSDIKDKYIIKGRTFIPLYNMSQMNVSQYLTYQHINKEKNILENLALGCSCMLTPKDKGKEYDVEQEAEWLADNWSIDEAYSFFRWHSTLFQALTKTYVRYLEKKMRKELKKKNLNKEQIQKLKETISHLQAYGVGNI